MEDCESFDIREYLQNEIDSMKCIFFEGEKENRYVVAGGYVNNEGTHYEIVSFYDFGDKSPLVWSICYPEDIVEMNEYLSDDVAWMNKVDRNANKYRDIEMRFLGG